MANIWKLVLSWAMHGGLSSVLESTAHDNICIAYCVELRHDRETSELTPLT